MPSETIDAQEFVAQLTELYRERVRKAGLPPAPIQYAIPIRYDHWLELKEWYEATKDMTEQEYIAYYESVYGVGSWASEDD